MNAAFLTFLAAGADDRRSAFIRAAAQRLGTEE
jgi:hypothetical protein